MSQQDHAHFPPAARTFPVQHLIGRLFVNLFLRKSIDGLVAEAEATSEHGLRRVLGPVNLISMGIGAIIGTGIFVLIGTAAATYAGPGIIFSILLAGFACALAGLCYSEFASMIPMAGSAYTYCYATL